MNFLVTGANGFVGYALTRTLSAKNNVVAALRSFNTDESLITQLLIKDINAPLDWFIAISKIDVVIHLAARVHVIDELSSDPLYDFLEVNLYGTLNLAKYAAKSGVKRFVYISSVKVNGEYTEHKPFDEDDSANPHDAYAVSKWRAEQALRQLSKEIQMEIVIIRPPLVYGSGVKANFLRLLKLVNKSIPMPLACIRNQRSMIYVGNLVDAIITCATHPKAANQTYLVSDGESVSTPQLIRNIAQASGKRVLLLPFPISMMKFLAKLFGKSAAVDRLTQSLVIDSSKIRRELDWTPPFTMTQGLKATADWYKNQK